MVNKINGEVVELRDSRNVTPRRDITPSEIVDLLLFSDYLHRNVCNNLFISDMLLPPADMARIIKHAWTSKILTARFSPSLSGISSPSSPVLLNISSR